MMKIVTCQFEPHGQTILDIFNQAIATSTALYDYEPRTLRAIAKWFEVKAEFDHPVIGMEDNKGIIRGFATYGTFRNYAAYKYSVEHSVYVDSKFRQQGIGRKLLLELISLAQQQNYHTTIGAIDAENAVSIKLHQSLGFTHCGRIEQVGFKFGRWLDLELYQLILATPKFPTETSDRTSGHN
ncbi:MAG: N-acetyltransferase family protein [Cyanobacteria bacterium J06588_4]